MRGGVGFTVSCDFEINGVEGVQFRMLLLLQVMGKLCELRDSGLFIVLGPCEDPKRAETAIAQPDTRTVHPDSSP